MKLEPSFLREKSEYKSTYFPIPHYIEQNAFNLAKARNISMDALLESPTLNTYGYAFKVNDWTLTSFKAKMLHDIKTKIAELIESDQYDAQSIDVEYLVSTMLEDECLELTEDISNVMRAVIHNAMSSDQAQVALALVKTAVVTAGRKVSGDLVDSANELLAQ